MPPSKMVYVSEEAHRQIRMLAASRNRTMGQTVQDLVRREIEDQANAWTTPAGLSLQQSALNDVWNDRALDVYNDD